MEKLKIHTENNWTEVIIDDTCNYELYDKAIRIIEQGLNARVIQKMDDLENFYWDFEMENYFLTLHYNLYSGLSLFPTNLGRASVNDNAKAVETAQWLFMKLAL